jgi:hypothetical protein
MSLNWDYVLSIFNIILIDLALSGDNAIVIAMAASTLPKSRRTWAIVIGGGGAIVLRIALTSLIRNRGRCAGMGGLPVAQNLRRIPGRKKPGTGEKFQTSHPVDTGGGFYDEPG